MTIILSDIWGTGPRSKMCRSYVFEYIQMIQEIVEEGIKKGLKDAEINNYADDCGMKVATDFIKDIFSI